MKKLPLGIQTFKKLREQKYLYIDKTELIYKIVTEGSVYFLSRPRRFGKSLTLSTIGSIFDGEKELFKGLYIYDKKWQWKKWPVLRFDFSGLSEEQGVEELKLLIKTTLKKTVKEFALQIDEVLPYNQYFQAVLENLPKEAVILIDEYDKPILNYITEPDMANKVKEILKGFYTVIKAADAHVRFAFLTGVTKFAKISVFSGLNNLTDLTMREAYADLCGYTEDELDEYFADALQKIALEESVKVAALRSQMREWYNGFRFSSKDVRVYNPVSILNFLQDQKFKPYWFETGTPAFLTELMKKEGFAPENMEKLSCRDSDFSTYEIENLLVLPILFQSGYITIREYMEQEDVYVLGYPNREVKTAFLENLLKSFVPKGSGIIASPLLRLTDSLAQNDLELFFENLDILFSKIPYDIHLPYEKYWQSLFYMIFTLMGYYIEAEYKTSRGRIDAFINMKERIYIFEFKLLKGKEQNTEKLLKEAEQQIQETDYAKRFLDSGKPVTLLPVVFEYDGEKAVVARKEMEG